MTLCNPTKTVSGFAWYASPDGASPAGAARPFDFGVPRACEAPLRARAYWPVGAGSAGVRNAGAAAGLGYLILTTAADAPDAGLGWVVEPASLDAICFADGGNLRVAPGVVAAPGARPGHPPRCSFEVSEG